MLRRTVSPTPAPLALWAARALGFVPTPPKTPYLSAEWCAERDNRNPKWRDCFNELATEQNELPLEPDADQPLSGFTLSASDDLDVSGFLTTYGVETTMLHSRPEQDHPFIHWMKTEGAFVVGKLKNSTAFARQDCATLANNPAAIAVSARACDVALCGSILGPSAITAPVTADVFAFKPSAAALPYFDPPFSKRYSLGFVARHLGVAEKLWQEMVGRPQRNQSVNLLSQFEDDDEATISRPLPDYLQLNPKDRPQPTIKLGVPVDWINEVLGKPGCGEALAEALQTKVKAKVRQGRHVSRVGKAMSTIGRWIVEITDREAAERRKELEAKKAKEEQEKEKSKIIDIEVQSVNINWDIRAVIDIVSTIINYELSRSLQQRQKLTSSLLDHIPKQAVNAIYTGKDITDRQYESAVAEVNVLRQDMLDEMRNTDCLCMPLLSPPFQNMNLRAIGFAIPFSLIGCSCASFRLPLANVSGDASKYKQIREVGVVHSNRSFSGMEESDEAEGLRLVPNDYDGGATLAKKMAEREKLLLKKRKKQQEINLKKMSREAKEKEREKEEKEKKEKAAALKETTEKAVAAAAATAAANENGNENSSESSNTSTNKVGETTSPADSLSESQQQQENKTQDQRQQSQQPQPQAATTAKEEQQPPASSSSPSTTSSSPSSTSTTAADDAATKAIEEEIQAIDEILKEKKYSTSSNEISLPIFLVAEPGQDTIIFEAARSLLNRVD